MIKLKQTLTCEIFMKLTATTLTCFLLIQTAMGATCDIPVSKASNFAEDKIYSDCDTPNRETQGEPRERTQAEKDLIKLRDAFIAAFKKIVYVPEADRSVLLGTLEGVAAIRGALLIGSLMDILDVAKNYPGQPNAHYPYGYQDSVRFFVKNPELIKTARRLGKFGIAAIFIPMFLDAMVILTSGGRYDFYKTSIAIAKKNLSPDNLLSSLFMVGEANASMIGDYYLTPEGLPHFFDLAPDRAYQDALNSSNQDLIYVTIGLAQYMEQHKKYDDICKNTPKFCGQD